MAQRRLQIILQFFMLLITVTIYGVSYYLFSRQGNLSLDQVFQITIAVVIVIPILSLLVSVLTLAPFLFFYIMTAVSFIIATFIIPRPYPALYEGILLWGGSVIGLSFVVFMIYKIRLIRRELLQYHDTSTEQITKIQNSLAPLFGQGLIRKIANSEIRLWYYCFYVWFKAPEINKENSYTYHKDSIIKVLVWFGCIMLLFDVTLFHFLIGLFSKTLAWLISISSIYMLFQIIAFYNSCLYEPHLVRGESIIIRLGFFCGVEFNVNQIESFQAAKPNYDDHKKEKGTFNCILGMDSPQYEIILKEPIWMRNMMGGKEEVTKILLKVDEPNAFYQSVNSKLELINS